MFLVKLCSSFSEHDMDDDRQAFIACGGMQAGSGGSTLTRNNLAFLSRTQKIVPGRYVKTMGLVKGGRGVFSW